MRILFLNGSAALGGAERLLIDLMASLADAGAGVSLHLALGEDGPLADLARGVGAEVHPLPLPAAVRAMGDSGQGWGRLLGQGLWAGWQARRYVGRLAHLIADVAPDVVHSNSLKYHLLGAAATPRTTPLVWHLHDFVGSRRAMRRALGWAARRAAGAVAVSHAVALDAAEALGRLKVAVVPNGIDTERFTPGGRAAALDDAPVRVGLVATFARWKGHAVFLDAAARLAHTAARFYVVGGPIYRTVGSQWSEAELRALAGPNVAFVPFQADAAPVFRALDVVVHASTQPEPFGLTIAEGMACGRAVITTGQGGAAELFTPGHDAVAVPPNDPAALADALARLIAEPLLRRRLGAAARETAVARFGRAALGPRVLAAYRSFAPVEVAS